MIYDIINITGFQVKGNDPVTQKLNLKKMLRPSIGR